MLHTFQGVVNPGPESPTMLLDDRLYRVGDRIELTEDQLASFSQYFVFGDGSVDPNVEVTDTVAENGSTITVDSTVVDNPEVVDPEVAVEDPAQSESTSTPPSTLQGSPSASSKSR